MIKKILFGILVIVLLANPNVLANDGGLVPGTHITYEFIPESKEIELGEKFDFTLKITNRTGYSMEVKSILELINGDDSWTPITSDGETYGIYIEPYETIEVQMSAEVPFDIDWYKENDKFYVDVESKIYFRSLFNAGDDYEALYEFYREYGQGNELICTNSNDVTLEIVNLKDGSDLMEMTSYYEDSITYYRDDWSNLPNVNLFPLHTSSACITNISDKECKILSHNDEMTSTEKEEVVLNPYERFYFTHRSCIPYMSTDDKMNEVTERNSAIFSCDGEYYGVLSYRTLTVKNIISQGYIRVYREIYGRNVGEDGENVSAKIMVENVSGKTLENFYFDFDGRYWFMSNANYYDVNDDCFEIFRPGEILTYDYQDVSGEPVYSVGFDFGFEYEDIYYLYDVYNSYFEGGRTVCNLVAKTYLSEAEPTSTPPLLVTPVITPTSTPEATPAKNTKLPDITPTPTATHALSNSDDMPEDDSYVVVNSVDNLGKFPKWIWYVLAVSVAVCVLFIFFFRYNAKHIHDKDE